jgi:hypothetical protein
MAFWLQRQNSPRHIFQHLCFVWSGWLKAGQPPPKLVFQIHMVTALFRPWQAVKADGQAWHRFQVVSCKPARMSLR